MLHLDGAIIVEGKYDKIKISGIFDCPVIVTNGFRIFNDPEKRAIIRHFAQNGGIIILTDSDAAGFKIRGYVKSIVPHGKIINVYIPDIYGVERRKKTASAEGKIGVEGVPDKVILEAFERAGIMSSPPQDRRPVSRADLYEDGLFGTRDSSFSRARLLKRLGLPEHMSAGGLLDIINSSMTFEEYKALAEEVAHPQKSAQGTKESL